MKQYLIALLCALLPLAAHTQNMGSGFTIGVAVPDASNELTDAQRLRLESKLVQIIEKSGVATAGYSNGMLLKAVIDDKVTRVADGGMENMAVTTCQLTLYVVNAGDNMVVYNTMSCKIKGSGNTDALAMSNAITNIDVRDAQYKRFIAASQQKVVDWYGSNCQKIMSQATDAERRHDYAAAVSLLYSIPIEVPCHATAAKRARDLYAKYERQLCDGIVTYARGEVAIGNYEDALNALAIVEANSACADSAKQLIAETSKKVQHQIDRQYTLEEQRARAIATLATAYYSRTARRKK